MRLHVTTVFPGLAAGIVNCQVEPLVFVIATGPTAAPLLYVMVTPVIVPAVVVTSALMRWPLGAQVPVGTETFAKLVDTDNHEK